MPGVQDGRSSADGSWSAGARLTQAWLQKDHGWQISAPWPASQAEKEVLWWLGRRPSRGRAVAGALCLPECRGSRPVACHVPAPALRPQLHQRGL